MQDNDLVMLGLGYALICNGLILKSALECFYMLDQIDKQTVNDYLKTVIAQRLSIVV